MTYMNRIGFVSEKIASENQIFFNLLKKAVLNKKDYKVKYVKRGRNNDYFDLVTIINYKNKYYKSLPVPIFAEAMGEKFTQQRDYCLPQSLRYKFKWITGDKLEEIKSSFMAEGNIEFLRLHKQEFDNIPEVFYSSQWKKEIETENWGYVTRYSRKFNEDGELVVTEEECHIFPSTYEYMGEEITSVSYNYGNWKTIPMKDFKMWYEICNTKEWLIDFDNRW